jgi:hypothetical protein
MTPKQLINFCLLFLLIVFIGIGTYGAWLATQSLWPGLHEDGSLYSTVIINRSNGFGNIYSVHVNQYYLELQNTDFSYDTKFNFHGQLYYPFLAALMPGNDYASLLRVTHVINLIILPLSIWLFYLVIKRVWNFSRLVSLGFASSLAYSVLGILQYLQGRPEHGSVIVIVIFGLLRELFFLKQTPAWFSGILIGILVGISPLSGAYYGLFYSFTLAVTAESSRRLISNLLTCVTVSSVTWAGLTSIVYSESLWLLIVNTIKSGGTIYASTFLGLSNFSIFHVTLYNAISYINPFAPFAIFSYLVTFSTLTLEILLRIIKRPQFPLRTIAFIAVLIIFLRFWYVSIVASGLNYNVLAFFPAMVIWLFKRLTVLNRIQSFQLKVQMSDQPEWRSNVLFTSVTFQKFIPFFVVLLFSLPGLGYFRSALMQRSIIKNGVSYTVARDAYQKLKSQLTEDEVVMITRYSGLQSRSAVVLDGPPWKMVTLNYWYENLDMLEAICRIKAKYLIFMQSRELIPPEIQGFQLIDDGFNRTPVKLFGKMIRLTTPGYGYAVYLRNHLE